MGRAAHVLYEGHAAGTDSDEQGEQGSSQAAAAAAAAAGQPLWPPATLERLRFVARSDPSVKVRREAVKLLGMCLAAATEAQEVGEWIGDKKEVEDEGCGRLIIVRQGVLAFCWCQSMQPSNSLNRPLGL